MEKYSAYRDPGTGIQYPIPPLYRIVTHLFTAILSRSALLFLGLWWIPVESVTRKRGRGNNKPESWNPKAGDLIVANWCSWIELLWLAFRFNPVFVLPVSEPVQAPKEQVATPISRTPGRRTGTGSANIVSQATRAPTTRAPIVGFQQVSLLTIICHAGKMPRSTTDVGSNYQSLKEIQRQAGRPVVVFPECTTSNGRGLLRFADVFKGYGVPTKGFRVFMACFRYDPPTALSPSMALSIPSSSLNPLPHLFSLASSLKPLVLSVRLLAPSDGPSSPTFIASEVISGEISDDTLSAVSAGLIAQLGKFKRVTLGWEDKAFFLEFYHQKRG
ncbi:hypothetical protein EWM64_g190 [Hericium alpestre]|uniref:Phospholipid/glycerol acyltransferase domain-containing protein n=1 Tax=Hericium alpestre TaxID=135208 RepID=A0A4Z0ABR9_9AGAM|nr:hypothetical protein EWM64_g190 [Hericium alpestre]